MLNKLAHIYQRLFGASEKLLEIQQDLEQQYAFLTNRQRVILSTQQRLASVRDRYPQRVERVQRLEEIFLSRVTNASNMTEVSASLHKLLKTLDRERLH